MDDFDAPPPKSSWTDSTKTTLGVLIALAVVLIAAGIGIATIRNARDTVEKAVSSTTTVAATGGSTVPDTTPASDLTPAQAKVVEEIKAQVASIRGLAWKGSLPIKVVSKEALAARVRKLNAEEIAKKRDELTADESVLKLLKLIEKDVDYAKTIDSILAGGVLGFYDDEVKELYVGGGGESLDPATRATLAHELTHALTDQHFDFGTRTKALDDQEKTEESAAFSALIEGDAELVATLWQQQHLTARERQQAANSGSSEAISAYARAPRYMLESLFFPYTSGLTFVESRHTAGGFAEVDKAYRNPPTSTEHILHPETYASGQTWSPPAVPDLAAATGCGAVDTGTLGEFDMIQILSGELASNDAEKAAVGWNGDAYGAVRCGSALGLADRWQTDTPADAGRLADALARWARGWSGATRAADADGRVTGPTGSARVVRNGARIDIILADDQATADRLAGAVLAR
jgi:Zn-dependent peptidase ImmA (M78 family)